MATSLGKWSRLIRAADAAGLAHLLVLSMLLILSHASALHALGIVFAVPIYLAAAMWVVRWMRYALTGRLADRSPLDRERFAPRAHLGRPSWERAGRRAEAARSPHARAVPRYRPHVR